MIQPQVRRSRPVSTKAEKFSTLPWPYWWSASAGLSETPTEKNVMRVAMRSSPEWAASDRMPRLPVVNPTTILSPVMTRAARTEFPAAARFSARIDSSEDTPELPDMRELSLEGAESAKQIGARRMACPDTNLVLSCHSCLSRVGQRRSLVLGFRVWHFFTFPVDQSWRKRFMRKSWLLCVLLGALAWGQAAPAPPQAQAPASHAPAADTSAAVPADAAVITVNGVCPEKPNAATAAGTPAKPATPAKTSAADCKTVITKAE